VQGADFSCADNFVIYVMLLCHSFSILSVTVVLCCLSTFLEL